MKGMFIFAVLCSCVLALSSFTPPRAFGEGPGLGLTERPASPAAGPETPAAVEPGPPPKVNVWVEAIFVELDRATMRDFEESLGFKLSPPDGKAFLTGDEKENLLALVEKDKRASLVASLAVVTPSGQQAQGEDVEEVSFPAEYDTETINIGGGFGGTTNLISGEVFMVTPANWETRDVGAILNVTPTLSPDGRMVTLILMPEVTQLARWINYGTESYPIMKPVFRTWGKTATVTVPNGSSFVFKELPMTSLRPERAETVAPGSLSKGKKQEERRQPGAIPFEQQLNAYREELARGAAELAKMRRRFTLDKNDQPIQYQRLEQFVQQRSLVSAEIAKLKSFVERMGAMTDEERVNAAQDNPAICTLAAEVAKQEAALEASLEEYGAEHPEVKGRKNSIAALKRKLEAFADGLLEFKKVTLDALQNQERQLSDAIEKQEKEIAESQRAIEEYERAKADFEIRKSLLLKMEETQLIEKLIRSVGQGHPTQSPSSDETKGPPSFPEPGDVAAQESPAEQKAERSRRPGAVKNASPQRKDVLKKLETIIPEVKFEDASLAEVIDVLSRQAGVRIVIDPVVHQPPFSERIKDTGTTVSLNNVPVKEVLKYILRYKNLKYVAEDNAIAIVPVDYAPPESLRSEIFRFPELADLSANETGAQRLEDFLRQSGIPWPEGSRIAFDAKTGTLVVTNTRGNLALIRELVAIVSPPDPLEKANAERKVLLTIVSARIIE
jgi:hypothetical protein